MTTTKRASVADRLKQQNRTLCGLCDQSVEDIEFTAHWNSHMCQDCERSHEKSNPHNRPRTRASVEELRKAAHEVLLPSHLDGHCPDDCEIRTLADRLAEAGLEIDKAWEVADDFKKRATAAESKVARLTALLETRGHVAGCDCCVSCITAPGTCRHHLGEIHTDPRCKP